MNGPEERPQGEAAAVADVRARLEAVRERIARAAVQAGRRPEEVRLIAVSKTVPLARLRAAAAAGVRDFGENRVQELVMKADAWEDPPVRWHMIGHLQRNKARDVCLRVSLLHSLDSLRLAAELDRHLQKLGRRLPVLVQVNTSGEATKHGVAPDQLLPFLRELSHLDTLAVRGLMTIARQSADADVVRGCFRLLRELRDRALATGPEGMQLEELSMGMSADLELAVAEGATLVRVGTALFGPRPA
ncbi:MAG: YggS family pyridoxal phosphate-dependent enzyme [Clostridia bacterium]|nr:YggS family pyridoxal phosphate-dependent enzyme [Clostridia bacterium]